MIYFFMILMYLMIAFNIRGNVMDQELMVVLSDRIANHIERNKDKGAVEERLALQLANWICYGVNIKGQVDLWVSDCMLLSRKRGEPFLDTFLHIKNQAQIIAENERDETRI